MTTDTITTIGVLDNGTEEPETDTYGGSGNDSIPPVTTDDNPNTGNN